MKTRFFALITLCALLVAACAFFCACDSDKNGEGEKESSTASSTETSSETTSETTDSSEETTEAAIDGYKVTVVDENGTPLAGVYVQFCRGDLCMAPYPTDENGVIIYDYADDDYTVKAIDYDFVYESLEPEYTLNKGTKTLTIVMKKVG